MNNFSLKQDIVLCSIQKNELAYIEEWLKYYIEEIQFDKIYLYNDDDNPNKIYEIDYVNELIKQNKLFIKPTDYKGVGKLMHAYSDFYNNNDFYWVAYFDIDEFLDLKEYKTIRNYINSFNNIVKDDKVNVISFPWKAYGDNDKLYYENIPVRKRFINPSADKFQTSKDTENIVLVDNNGNNVKLIEKKFMVKHGIDGFIMNNPHYILSNNENIVPYLSNFSKDILYYNTIQDTVNNKLIYTFAYSFVYDGPYPVLNHYRTKTCEEFINKIIKGKPDMDSSKDFWPISLFFESNEYSKEKENLMQNLLNKLIKHE